jgi:drug/metabolite transporter (DMT)-like permease
VLAAFGAALLFGAGTPLAKLLLDTVNPWLLAGLLYLGSGIGLTLYRLWTHAPVVRLPRHEVWWFAGAIVAGGVAGPGLLMLGLTGIPASSASLLLTSEGLFTTLLAWFVFKENFDRRILLGMIAILAGTVILSWPRAVEGAAIWPALAVLGACLAWGIDNNLTRKVSLNDATWIAARKGMAAGTFNLLLAGMIDTAIPAATHVAAAMLLGLFAYGVSLALFVVGLRHLGAARTGAYFSVAPFFGALLALAMGETMTLQLGVAGALMALGVWLHLTEHHEHEHDHPALAHEHEHVHDEHHQHAHDTVVAADTRHTHWHQHEPLTHRHSHYPDAHHQHQHKKNAT